MSYVLFFFFFFNDTATTEIYTLSLHDALPICLVTPYADGKPEPVRMHDGIAVPFGDGAARFAPSRALDSRSYPSDRKSTRLNSSHANISYAVFCLKKKK